MLLQFVILRFFCKSMYVRYFELSKCWSLETFRAVIVRYEAQVDFYGSKYAPVFKGDTSIK